MEKPARDAKTPSLDYKLQKDALQASKEILVKFIETGRISPANFSEVFPAVYKVVLQTIRTETGLQ